MAFTETLDAFMLRVLRVTPHVAGEASSAPAERAFGLSLAVSGLRCILQYVVLPIVLPLIGLAGGFSLAIVLVLDIVALTLLISSLRFFWRTQHPRRFDMLPLAGVIILLVIGSLSFDIWNIVAAVRGA
jgi:hypothetical protein